MFQVRRNPYLHPLFSTQTGILQTLCKQSDIFVDVLLTGSQCRPKMQKYHKGPLVYTMGDLAKGADDKRIWAMYRQKVYDM